MVCGIGPPDPPHPNCRAFLFASCYQRLAPLCSQSFRPTSHESLGGRSLIRHVPLESGDTDENPTSKNYRFSDQLLDQSGDRFAVAYR